MRKIVYRLFSGLQWRLLVLVLLVCAPLVKLALHTASQERRRLEREWKQRSQEIMVLATREESQIISQTRQLLLALADSAPVLAGNQQGCKKLLDELFGSYPRYANFGVIRTNGSVLASVRPMVAAPNQTNRWFFRRVLTTRAFAIGDFPDGLVVGKPIVYFGYPVLDSAGQLRAVVFAALDLDWISRFESAVPTQLPKGATWTEIDRAGKILVRYPAPEKWIGLPFEEKSLLKTVFSQKQGVVEAVSADGVLGYHAFAAMQSQLVPDGVVAILSSIPKQVLFAETDLRLTENLIGLGIAAVFAFILGWLGSYVLILRPVRTLVKSSARLATGELSTRTGLAHRGDELGQLTRAFDQMAQSLESRELERRSTDHALKASELRYHRLFETALDGILILNADTGQIEDVNPFLTELVGYTREQLLGNKLWEIGPFKGTQAYEEAFRALQREAYVRYDDLSLVTCAGQSISVEFFGNVYRVDGRRVIQCHLRDITKRKRAEEEVQASEERMRLATEATAVGIWEWNILTNKVRWDAQMFRIYGIAPTMDGFLQYMDWSGSVSPEDLARQEEVLQDTVRTLGHSTREFRIQRSGDGEWRNIQSVETVRTNAQGQAEWVVGTNLDITERKRAEAKVKQSNRKLQVLSRRLVEAQETERRHIARELHDELGQTLTVAQLNLQALLQLPGSDGKPRLKQSLEAVERVLEQVRDIALNLRPSMLDDLGLAPALVWLTHRQAELAGLKGEVHADALEHRLDTMIETACFRIAQESLTNVVRHAQAKTVIVELRQAEGQLHLRVRDDGIGFDVVAIREKAVRGASLGLLSMEERAVLAGGQLEFTSVPGHGSEVHAWFPLKWQPPLPGSEVA